MWIADYALDSSRIRGQYSIHITAGMQVGIDMDLLYLCGFFDGEGSIVTHHSAFELHLTQASLPVLNRVALEWGGRIVVQRDGDVCDKRHNGSRRKVWRWKLVGYPAVNLLRRMLSHLIVKQDRAIEALAWWDGRVAMRKRRRMPNEFYATHKGLRRIRLCEMSASELRAEAVFRKEWLDGYIEGGTNA